jgi:hypothetical protein
MTSGGATVDRLREYLRQLPVPVRAQLITELERKVLRGEDLGEGEVIIEELRRLFRESRQTAPRYGMAARLFYDALLPFTVDDHPSRPHPGRIARVSLDPLWTWIKRDLLPDDANIFVEAANAALLANNDAQARALARAFQDKVAIALGNISAGHVDDKGGRRPLAQASTTRAEDDVRNLTRILSMRDVLEQFAEHLPGYIADFTDARLEQTHSLILSAASKNPDITLYAMLVVMRRLAAPWQLIRLAPRNARGIVTGSGPFAVAVSIVMLDLARLADELRNDLRAGGVATIGLLQAIHDAARGLRVELDPGDSTTNRELAGLRTQISAMLQSEIESLPGRVRRLLRPRPSSEIRPGSTLDEAEVAEAEALMGLVSACRQFAGELALNEMTLRAFSEVQQYLDSSTGTLLDGLRQANPNDRAFRQSQADAAVRFCRKAFGPDYAAMLTKAAEVAASQERPPAPQTQPQPTRA